MSLQPVVAARSGSLIGQISHAACTRRSGKTVRGVVAARAAAARSGHDPTGLSSLRLAKPTPASMEDLMQQWQG